MAVIPSVFPDCVVAIGAGDHSNVSWVASGFFYGQHIGTPDQTGDSLYRIYLVTNKHVLKDIERIYLRINPSAAQPAKQVEVPLIDPASGQNLWTGHERPEVDVAVLPINYESLAEQGMQVSYFASDQHSFVADQMLDAGISEGQPIFVLGFPMGLVGGERNTVIVRGGVIARVRDTLANPLLPYLVDAVVFPGNSGGPVITKPELVAITTTPRLPRADLIGIVASYIPYRDVAVSLQTGRPRVSFDENSGLSNVFSVDCIRDSISTHENTIPGKAGRQAEPTGAEPTGAEPTGAEISDEGVDTNGQFLPGVKTD